MATSRSKESRNKTIWIISERSFARKASAPGGGRFELIVLNTNTDVTRLGKNDYNGLRHRTADLRENLTNFRLWPPIGQSACRLEAKVRKLKPSPWKIGLSFGTALAIHG